MRTAQFATLCLTCLLGILPVAASAAPPIPLDIPFFPGNTPVPPRNYVISSDGTEATDPLTGLTWRRCAAGMYWNGSGCAGDMLSITYKDAVQYGETEAKRTGLDWHLPTLKELATIGYLDRHSDYPALDRVAFPNTPAQSFWSSSLDEDKPGYAWYLSFTFGGAGSHDVNSFECVRLVRGKLISK